MRTGSRTVGPGLNSPTTSFLCALGQAVPPLPVGMDEGGACLNSAWHTADTCIAGLQVAEMYFPIQFTEAFQQPFEGPISAVHK